MRCWMSSNRSSYFWTLPKGTLGNLLDALNEIRLSRSIELAGKQGKPKVTYQLEEMSKEHEGLMQALNLSQTHLKPLKIEGVSVYN